MDTASDSAVLGRRADIPADPDSAVLDRVPNANAGDNYLIRFTVPEFTSLCPITGQPDFAHLVFDYVADQWLGTGFGFPLLPDTNGKLGYVAGLDLVRQSIETILDTDPGERIMRPSFGCGLRRYLMAPNTLTTRTAMADEITAALDAWEPRIQVTNVSVTPDDNPTLVWIETQTVVP